MNALLITYTQNETPIEIAVVVLSVGELPSQVRWHGKTPVRVRLPWGVEVTVEAKDLGFYSGPSNIANISATDPFDPVVVKAALAAAKG